MLQVLSRRSDAFLLPFGHPVHADFRIQVDVDFILIKHRMFRLPLSQRLLNSKVLFIIVRVFDFQRWCGLCARLYLPVLGICAARYDAASCQNVG